MRVCFDVGSVPLCRYHVNNNVTRAKEGDPDVSNRVKGCEERKELELTMSGWVRASFPGGRATLWTINLSLHLASNGGSSSMACNVTGSPPQNVISPVENGRRKHTTHLEAQGFDRAPLGPNLVLRSTARDGMVSISTLESGTKNLGIETDPGSRCLNPECHGLGIVVRDRESAFYALSERP